MPTADDYPDVELVVRLVAQVVRTGPFPPPAPYTAWTDDAVMAQATELYLKKGPALAAEARVAAGQNQQHLERRLLRTIRNALIDEAKATPVGLMRSRLHTMLDRDPGFVRVSGPGVAVDGWARAGTPGAVDRLMWHGDRGELEAAAWSVRVPPEVVLRRSGPAPRATRDALLEVLHAVFAAADGLYLPDQVLAHVVHDRFEEFIEAETRDAAGSAARLPEGVEFADAADAFADVDAADVADWLWVDMSFDERTTVSVMAAWGAPMADDGSDIDADAGVDADTGDGAEPGYPPDAEARREAVMAAVGCGPVEAQGLLEAVHARVRGCTHDDVEAGRVLGELLELGSRRGSGSGPEAGSAP